MREQRRVAAAFGRPVDDTAGTPRHVVQRLATRGARPHGPPGTLGADLRGGETFVLAVVPFHEVVIGLHPVAVAGEAARLHRARQRRRQHRHERAAGEHPADRGGLLAPGRGQGHVAAAGVLAGGGPLGFAVTDEPQLARCPGRAHRALTASDRASTRLSAGARRPRPAPTSWARTGGRRRDSSAPGRRPAMRPPPRPRARTGGLRRPARRR